MTILLIGIGFLFLVLCITAIDTQSNGFFTQERIGQHGKSFLIYKLRTLHAKTNKSSFWGQILRKTKLDELPQLLNILKGEMTFVGPRPDVSGYADELVGADQILNGYVIFGENMGSVDRGSYGSGEGFIRPYGNSKDSDRDTQWQYIVSLSTAKKYLNEKYWTKVESSLAFYTYLTFQKKVNQLHSI